MRRTPARVLLVDDDVQSQELYAEILQWAGFDVRTAGDGESALKTACTVPLDAIILDINLPHRDGFAVLGDLRHTPETATVPVIALTGHPELADEARLRRDFHQVLEKPCEPSVLISTLRKVSGQVLSKL